mgnify:CR=1 FL=1
MRQMDILLDKAMARHLSESDRMLVSQGYSLIIACANLVENNQNNNFGKIV